MSEYDSCVEMLKAIKKSKIKKKRFALKTYSIAGEKKKGYVAKITLTKKTEYNRYKIFIININPARSISYLNNYDWLEERKDHSVKEGVAKYWDYFPEDVKREMIFHLGSLT
tara:strand:- start:472 stop:807 length:336 start_codon:yes stop_codon:yes gene_type:complete